jgi:hypothetical protein
MENVCRLLAGSERSRVEGRFTVVGHFALAYSVNMPLVVNISPESEKVLRELAAWNGRSVPEMAGELLEEKLKEMCAISPTDEDRDFAPDPLKRAIARMTNVLPKKLRRCARLFQRL